MKSFVSNNPAGRTSWALVAVVMMIAFLAMSRTVFAANSAAVGQPAPAFTATDALGKTHSLSDYRGKVVVLEWTNHECPFVDRHYGAGAMQALQREAADKGVVWLSVISSAPGEQGHVTPAKAQELTVSRSAAPSAVLFDPSGTIGRAYGAKTTPHMYVVDQNGILVYMGAIDDQPRNFGSDPFKARNYVRESLTALQNGSTVPTPVTQAYGCSVKYAS